VRLVNFSDEILFTKVSFMGSVEKQEKRKIVFFAGFVG